MKGKWTYETCLEEAKKYDKKTDFQTKSGGAYDAARKNGWLLDYDWFINAGASISASRTKWTYETCFEEAKKYKTRGEFQKGSRGAYRLALKNGWLDVYTWFEETHKPNGYWTYERCFEEAKKYKTRNELQKGCGSAYIVALKNGWLSDYIWFDEIKKPNGYWTHETCFEEAKKYNTRNEFKKGVCGAYIVARKNGWLDIFFPVK